MNLIKVQYIIHDKRTFIKTMAKNILKEAFRKSFLFKLTCRTSLFFGTFLIVLCTFYFSGNRQNFQDSTQLFILFLCSLDSIGLFLFSFAGMIESTVMFFMYGRRRMWIYFSVFFFSAALSSAIFFVARTLSILTQGYE